VLHAVASERAACKYRVYVTCAHARAGKTKTTLRKVDMEVSPVSVCFGGVLKTTIRYSASKASASLEPFWSIALDLDPDAKNITLRDALDSYFAEEKVCLRS
jgi:ubiquitin carboxyl-terminal hydrolase 10